MMNLDLHIKDQPEKKEQIVIETRTVQKKGKGKYDINI